MACALLTLKALHACILLGLKIDDVETAWDG